jgi:hypothetical protein
MVVVVTAVDTADMADMGMGGMGTEEAISTIAAAASTEARRTTRRVGNIAADGEFGFATDMLPSSASSMVCTTLHSTAIDRTHDHRFDGLYAAIDALSAVTENID